MKPKKYNKTLLAKPCMFFSEHTDASTGTMDCCHRRKIGISSFQTMSLNAEMYHSNRRIRIQNQATH